MKPKIGKIAWLASLLFATVISLNGCASVTIRQPVKTTATLQSVQDDYQLAKMQTEATNAALVELEVSPDPDLEQAYQTFSKSVERMQEIGERLVMHADAMQFTGAPYLVESEKTGAACVYPRLSTPENRRTAEIGDYFDPVAEKGWQVKRAYRAYQFDIGEIKNHLSGRLTPSGVQAIPQIMEKAKIDAESLQESLERAIAAIEGAKTAQAQEAAAGG